MASSPLSGSAIGFIGCGAMARALAGGLREAGVAADHIHAADPFEAARATFADATGARPGSDNVAVVAAADVVVIAVKPGMVDGALRALPAETSGAPLWISIAAGVPLDALRAALPDGARVVRTMPNTPALVGAGATAYFPGPGLTEPDLALTEAVLQAAGWCWRAPNEGLLDAVTGLSGSGPAYVFLILEALADAGVRQGLPRDAAPGPRDAHRARRSASRPRDGHPSRHAQGPGDLARRHDDRRPRAARGPRRARRDL